jgi:DNA-binding CsgD family transcriptional regulator/tetratricopeptide (TPR) repeat protein
VVLSTAMTTSPGADRHRLSAEAGIMSGVARPGTVNTEFVGRRAESARLAALLDVAPDQPASTTRALLLDGDAGVGKTRLLGELAVIARARGWTVALGHCMDFGDSALPYLPFSEVVGRLIEELPRETVAGVLRAYPAVERLQPGRRMLPVTDGEQRGASSASLDRSELFEAVHALLEAAASRAPLLLVVEDAHWADQSTREMLSFLFVRPFVASVVIVVSYRADDLHRRHPLRAQVGEWLRLRGVQRLHLEPLTDAAVRELIAALHPDPMSEVQLAEIIARAEGNPFFVEELVGVSTGSDHRLPTDLVGVLLARIDRLDESTRQVVRAASVAGRRVSHPQLAAVTGVAEPALDEALRQAVEANVLVTQGSAYAFRHALLAEATYDDLLPGERVRLHAAYAAALREGRASGTAAELARHARLAMDDETAIDASVRAGREAMSVGGPDEAVRHFEQALELLADPRRGSVDLDLAQLLLDTAEALLASGHPMRADALLAEQLDRLPADAPAAWRPRLLAARAEAMIRIEPEEDPREITAEAIRLLPPGEEEVRAAVLAIHARVLAAYGRYEEAQPSAAEALTLAEQIDLPLVASDATTTLSGLKRLGPPEALRTALTHAVARAESTGAVQAELRGRFQLGRSYEDHADWAEAERWYRSVIDKAEAASLPWSPNVFDARWQLTWLYWVQGRWDELLQLTDLTGQTPPRVSRMLLDLLRLQVEFARGRTPTELPAMREFWAVDGLVGIYACGLGIEVAGREGDPEAAVEAYDEGVAVLSAIWYPNFEARIRLAATAVAAVADNLSDAAAKERPALVTAAERLVAEGHGVRDNNQNPTGYWGPEGQAWVLRLDAELLRVHWLAGIDPPTAGELVEAWRETVRAFDSIDYVYEAARSRAVLAEILRASGDPAAADRERELAAAAARSLQAGPLLTRLGVVKEHAGRDRRQEGGYGGLTPRELEVLDLVAAGRSNSEIGQALFISRKTASVHVSNILAKLGAATRTEAVALARRRGLLHTS